MPTKADVESLLEQVEEILTEVYQPESSREQLAEAIGNALDLLSNDEDGAEDDEGQDGDDLD